MGDGNMFVSVCVGGGRGGGGGGVNDKLPEVGDSRTVLLPQSKYCLYFELT